MGEREAFPPGGLAPVLLLPKSLAGSTNIPFQNSVLYHVALAATGKCGSASAGSARASSSDPQVPRRRWSGSWLRRLGNAASPNSLDSLPPALQASYYPSHQNTCPDPADLSSYHSLLCSPSQQHPEGAIHVPFPSLNPIPYSSRSPTTSALSSPNSTWPGTACHSLLPELPKPHPPGFSLTSQAATSPGWLLLTSLIPSVRGPGVSHWPSSLFLLRLSGDLQPRVLWKEHLCAPAGTSPTPTSPLNSFYPPANATSLPGHLRVS